MKLQDRVCTVTGAASGIGKEIALTFAREGGKVAIVDVNKDAALAAARDIAKAGGRAQRRSRSLTGRVGRSAVSAARGSEVAAHRTAH